MALVWKLGIGLGLLSSISNQVALSRVLLVPWKFFFAIIITKIVAERTFRSRKRPAYWSVTDTRFRSTQYTTIPLAALPVLRLRNEVSGVKKLMTICRIFLKRTALKFCTARTHSHWYLWLPTMQPNRPASQLFNHFAIIVCFALLRFSWGTIGLVKIV